MNAPSRSATRARTVYVPGLAKAYWALGSGLKGQRLDSTLIGSNRYTSKEGCARFTIAVNMAAEAERQHEDDPSPAPTAAERRAAKSEREVQIDLARKRMAAAGRANARPSATSAGRSVSSMTPTTMAVTRRCA